MTSLADQIIAALRSGHDDLAAYAEHLDGTALTRPSGASEWDVSHVLSHLGSGAEIGLAALEAALDGGKALDGDFNKGVWARWDAMPAVEHRDGFLAANRRLVERYEGLDASTRESLRVDLGFLPAPVSVAEAARFRLVEFTYHAWDVKAYAEPATTLAPEAVPALLDGVLPLIGWIARPDALDGRQAALAVRLTDPERALGLDLGGSVAAGDVPARPDGTLRISAEAWLRLLAGRLAPQWTPASVEITGPVGLDDLRRVFPGY